MAYISKEYIKIKKGALQWSAVPVNLIFNHVYTYKNNSVQEASFYLLKVMSRKEVINCNMNRLTPGTVKKSDGVQKQV